MRSKLFLGVFLAFSFALTCFVLARFPVQRASPENILGIQPAASISPGRASFSHRLPNHARFVAHSHIPNIALPIRFEPASKSGTSAAQFVGRGGGITVLLTDDGMQFVGLPDARRSKALAGVTMKFSAAGSEHRGVQAQARRPLVWKGAERLAGETNYFLGNDPAKWRTHVPQFGSASTRGAIPGVDLIVYGSARSPRIRPAGCARNESRRSAAEVCRRRPSRYGFGREFGIASRKAPKSKCASPRCASKTQR